MIMRNMKALQEIVLKIMNRNLFLQNMMAVNLTFDQLNPKSTGIMSSYGSLTMQNMKVLE